VLTQRQIVVVQRSFEMWDVVSRADVTQHHRRVPLEPAQLRPLHRWLSERRGERCLIQNQDVLRQRLCVLPRDEIPRPQRRIISQRLGELPVPRTHTLGDVSVYQF